ncbi:MAG: hypothetical protein HY961_11560 [Ignavibacteriae bacterium]|nr:hypothetical protein [Ignavibacteriota bacterium]
MRLHRFLAVLFLLAILRSSSSAQIPRALSYQGVLTDSLGNPKPDGAYSFTFRLYESAAGGAPIWIEPKTLIVTRGLFHTVLGDQVAFASAISFARPYWLSIQLAGTPELLPRISLTSSAYSIASIRSDTARFALTAPQQGFVDSARVAGTIPNNSVTTAKIQDGAVTGTKIGTGHVVKRLNGISDAITLTAQGGATITSSNDTITINAGSGGGGTGVQGIQNTNNTLDVINPSGPTVTVNVKNSGITSTQLADNAVTSAKILNGTISFADIGQNSAASGQVMKWNGTTWAAAPDENGAGVFLPLGGGTLLGPITSSGPHSITMGKANFGSGNTNAGTHAFVAGQNNSAAGVASSVAGGLGNSASIDLASVGGGSGNTASGLSSRVGGGEGNVAVASDATVSGGIGNSASGQSAAIGGGENSIASGRGSVIGGGGRNRARGAFSVVAGGGGVPLSDSNSALGDYSTIGGGVGNLARGANSIVGGGGYNIASGSTSTISGGWSNDATGHYATIPGGAGNEASGDASFAAGYRARAIHSGAFVWGDYYSQVDVTSDTTDQFKIRASNGLNLSVNAGNRPIRKGDRYRDNAIVAWGKVSGAGSVSLNEFGTSSVVRNSAGNYTIVVKVLAQNNNTLIPIAIAETDAAPNSAATARIISINQTDVNTFDVYITNGNWTPTDNDFVFIVTAR